MQERGLSIALFLAAVLAAAAAPRSVEAKQYRIDTLVSSSQCRPDLPNCAKWYFEAPGDGGPVIDPDRVVFVSRTTSPGGFYDGVWSIELKSGSIKELVGRATPIPGGNGNFDSFAGGQSIGGGVVVFTGFDANRAAGMYTVDAHGGPIQLIVDTATAAPDGGTFNSWHQTRTNGQQVVFDGSTTTGRYGVYIANVDGTGLALVADDNTQVDDQNRWSIERGSGFYSVFSRPVIGQTLVSFYATEGDPSVLPNAVLQAPGFVDAADTLTMLAGDPASQTVHVMIGDLSAAADSDDLAFHGADNDNAFTGIFAAGGAASAEAFVTNQTVLADGTQLFGFSGFARDKSGLAFAASDDSKSTQSVYFIPRVGGPISLVASGSSYYLPSVTDRALSKGRITFFNGTIYENAIYLATPKS